MYVIRNFLSLVLAWALVAFPFAAPSFAGQSDIDLFAGGNRLPPNILIVLDSSGSMGNIPSGGGTDTK